MDIRVALQIEGSTVIIPIRRNNAK